MSKTSSSEASAQLKKALQILKRKGLYHPVKPRAEPTRYAISLTKKYADVIKGRATVVSAPSRKAAREQAEVFRVSGSKVVVPQSAFSKRARYSEKEGGIVQYATTSSTTYKFKPLRTKDGEIPDLKKGEVFSVPFKRGAGKIEFINATSKEELLNLINDYQMRSKNQYKEMLKFVQIGTLKARRKKASGEARV